MSLSLLLFSCNETAASKIKADSKSNSDLQPSYAEITFDKIYHDFGNVKEGEIAKTIFTFTNTGENDLYIVDAVGSCGCTVPKKPEKPIMPGEDGEIKVSYDTKRVGGFSKSITIMSNAKNPRKIIRIKGIVNKEISLLKEKSIVIDN